MIRHYFNPVSRALTTDWMLEELDVPHERVVVDFRGGENDTPEFRAINPMGKVPTLVDDGVVITETAAICAYLADKYADRGLAPPIESTARGLYYRCLFLPSAVLEPLFALDTAGFDNAGPQSAGWGDRTRVLATIEILTPERDWILASRFSAADVVFGGTLDYAIRFDWMKPSARVEAYVSRIRERPAYQKTHAGFGA